MMERKQRRGFTLIETLIAVALGITVLGAGMFVYLQGNKAFTTTTEHASFREEAMLCLENIARDLEQILVSDDKWASGGAYYMVEPYQLTHQYTLQVRDPETDQLLPYSEAGSGVTFFRYHHTDTTAGVPKLVGRKIEYWTEPMDQGDLSKGVKLMRNGQQVNGTPLSEIIFQKLPPVVATGQVQGSPNAILKVTIIPKGGMWRQMRKDTVDILKKDGTVTSRIFHLSGYESQYTANLFTALQRVKTNGGDPSVLNDKPILKAIFDDAKDNNGGQPPQAVVTGVNEGPAQGFVTPPNLVTLEDKPFNNNNAAKDAFFAEAEEIFVEDENLGAPPSLSEEFAGSGAGSETEQPNHCPAQQNH